MTVLVTGGAGYIGSHVVWGLLNRGEDVVVIDRLSTGFDWAVAPEAHLVVGDIGDGDIVAEAIRSHKVDAIIHFAGSIVVPESVSDPLGYYENNTVKSLTLIETAVKCRVPSFIFSSTAAIYGTAGMEPISEDAQLYPLSPYGRSKLMTEWMLADAAAAHDFRFTALRYFNVAGADRKGRTGQSTPGATHLIKVACETACGKRSSMEGIWHRLSDAGRYLRTRLYSCQRSGQCPRVGVGLAARQGFQPDRKLRIWSWLFRIRGSGKCASRVRQRF